MLPVKFGCIWPCGFRGEDFLNISQSETRIARGGHICIPIGTKWGNFVKDLPQMLPVKFACIWPCGFRGEDFWNISQSETRIARGGHICIPIGTKWGNFVKDLPQMLPVKFGCIWPCGFRGEDFWNISQSETRIACGGHICSPIGTKWGNFVKDLPQMLPVKFGSIWPCGFRGEDFWNISQSETRIARGGHICIPIGTKWGNFVKDLPQMLPVKFGCIWPCGFRGEDFWNISQSEQESSMAAMFFVRSGQNVQTL